MPLIYRKRNTKGGLLNRLFKQTNKQIGQQTSRPLPLITTTVKITNRNPVENCLEMLFTWHPSITSSRSMVSSDENIVSFGSQLLIKSTSGHTHSNTCRYSSEEYTIEIKYNVTHKYTPQNFEEFAQTGRYSW